MMRCSTLTAKQKGSNYKFNNHATTPQPHLRAKEQQATRITTWTSTCIWGIFSVGWCGCCGRAAW